MYIHTYIYIYIYIYTHTEMYVMNLFRFLIVCRNWVYCQSANSNSEILLIFLVSFFFKLKCKVGTQKEIEIVSKGTHTQ